MSDLNETYTIAGGRITFYPTPQYTTTRHLWCAAAYILDDADTYPDMTRRIANAILLKAESLILTLQANQAAQEAWQYAIGDEKINKEKLAETLAKQAKVANDAYSAAVEKQIGVVGMRG